MGFWWDIFQQYQIGNQSSRTGSVEERLAGVESELDTVYQVMEQMADRLDELEATVGPTDQVGPPTGQEQING